jgi:hypothetical protein
MLSFKTAPADLAAVTAKSFIFVLFFSMDITRPGNMIVIKTANPARYHQTGSVN